MGKDGNSNESGLNKNWFATKKTIAQGLLDLALLVTNIAQLKTVLDEGDSYPYYTVILTLIAISITGQIIVGIGMIILSRMDLDNPNKEKGVEILNDLVTIGIFLITVLNIVINGFTLNHDAAHHHVDPKTS